MQNILTIIHVSLDKMEAGVVENVNGTATPGNTTPATQQRKPVKLKAGFSLLKYVLLSIVTLGIYGLYCFARMGDLLNQIAGRYDGRRTMNYWLLCLLIGPLTLGIGYFVWYHRFTGRLGLELARRDVNYSIGARTFWLWDVLGILIIVGPLVYVYKVMHATNLLVERYNADEAQ